MGTTNYTWNPLTDSIIEESDGSGNALVTYTSDQSQFGELVSENRGGTTSYYHFDALGSTRVMTNSSQVAVGTLIYDAWGNTIASTGALATPYCWCGSWGYQADTVLGSYQVRERTYFQSAGRWASIDPATLYFPAETALLLLPFTYSSNAPVSRIDPSGLDGAVLGPPLNQQQIQDAIEMTQLARAAYPGEPVPLGWMSFDGETFTNDVSGFRAVLFYNPITDQTVLAYAGTDPRNWRHWLNSLQQAMGYESNEYEEAILLARNLSAFFPNLRLTGHSLGAGEASVASIVNDIPGTVTINAAGINPRTLLRHGADINTAPNLIRAIRVRGEVLSSIQDASPLTAYGVAGGGFSGLFASSIVWALPNGVGTTTWVNGSPWTNPFTLHTTNQAIIGLKKL